MIPARDAGIELYVRNRHPRGQTQFADDRVLLFVHGSTYPAEAVFDYPLNGLSWMQFIAQRGYEPSHDVKELLDRAEPIAVLYATPDGLPRRFRWRGAVHEIARAEGPERIAPEWWRERGTARLRDYYRIEDDAGARYWIYRLGLAGDGRGGAPEWFLQGLCA